MSWGSGSSDKGITEKPVTPSSKSWGGGAAIPEKSPAKPKTAKPPKTTSPAYSPDETSGPAPAAETKTETKKTETKTETKTEKKDPARPNIDILSQYTYVGAATKGATSKRIIYPETADFKIYTEQPNSKITVIIGSTSKEFTTNESGEVNLSIKNGEIPNGTDKIQVQINGQTDRTVNLEWSKLENAKSSTATEKPETAEKTPKDSTPITQPSAAKGITYKDDGIYVQMELEIKDKIKINNIPIGKTIDKIIIKYPDDPLTSISLVKDANDEWSFPKGSIISYNKISILSIYFAGSKKADIEVQIIEPAKISSNKDKSEKKEDEGTIKGIDVPPGPDTKPAAHIVKHNMVV